LLMFLNEVVVESIPTLSASFIITI
jgi:hypothetical protein